MGLIRTNERPALTGDQVTLHRELGQRLTQSKITESTTSDAQLSTPECLGIYAILDTHELAEGQIKYVALTLARRAVELQ